MQLQCLQYDGLPAFNRWRGKLPPADGQSGHKNLHIQYAHGQAHVLPPLWCEILLYPALAPGRRQR